MDFLAVQIKNTRKISNNPSVMNTISMILNDSNYRHSHIPKANNATALNPNIKFNTLMMKNNVGLPARSLSDILSLWFIIYYYNGGGTYL